MKRYLGISSYRYGGWRDVPGALPAGGPMPTGAPLPDNLRSYRVGVFRIAGKRSGVRYVAYTSARSLDARLGGYCPHGVSAASGDEAKRAAIVEHKTRCIRTRENVK